ncbi:MAG: cob(I)yrinic acid a,c-diamide adenosyltransferase [Propionibacteriaceae bacterium]|nr:cob(I)yrinic acid a,c-diamide adenosyltransferase [Propionibacteriaceae bacterium]
MPNVYTRTGDKGDTGLFGGSRVPKQSLRVEAYGTVDEANAALGQAKAQLPPGDWRRRVHQVQQRLFVLAAELASDAQGAELLAGKIDDGDVADLEGLIDDCLAITGPQREFVVPGRDERSGAFHQARTVVRRAERRVLTLAETEPVRPEVITYLNRLSDASYALARLAETWRDEELERTVRAAVARVLTAGVTPEPGAPDDLAGVVTTAARRALAAPAAKEFDLAAAKRAAELAEARAAELGVPVVIAAADASGNLVLLHRMPGALLAASDVAINKAWSAVAFKTATENLAALARDDGPFPGLADTNSGRVVLFGGGKPIFVGERLLGALGISGGSSEEDIDIATYALQAWNTDGS